MNKQQLHRLRYDLDTLYRLSFDNLSGEQRLAFLELINKIDAQLRALEEF